MKFFAQLGKGKEMNRFVRPHSITGLPYERINYTLLQLASGTAAFVQEAASYFVESWMSSALPKMRDIRRNWDGVSEADKLDYRSYLDHLFHNGELIDAPDKGYTSPIATFAETMLRWLRQSFDPTQLHVEPQSET